MEYAPSADKITIPVGGERALDDLSLARACVNKFIAADIDRGVIDTFARIALKEQEIAPFQILDGVDPSPAVVLGIGMCASAVDFDAGFGQTVVHETGTVKGIGTFVAEDIRVADLIMRAADHAVNAVRISGIVAGRF